MIARCLLVALAVAGSAIAQDSLPPKAPEFRLGDAATPLRYGVQLAIDPAGPRFQGEVRIELHFNRTAAVLWLNASQLAIESAVIRQGGREVVAKLHAGGDDFVGFESPGEPFAAGEAVATIRYSGVLDPLSTRGLFRQREDGEWYVVSQFEALSARRAFPCFDEPGWKTPWQLSIDAPGPLVVASNSPETSVKDSPARAGWKRHAFAETRPLPTYLVALAVGPFDVVDGGVAGKKKTPLRYLAPRGRGGELRYARQATPRLLEILEDYFGLPYPFEKLDTVTIAQTVNFGAMENAGLITYASRLLLATPHLETADFKRRYAAVAAHEIAHQWFGNYVTPAWWDDIWLNESFASWMGQKTLYRFEPAWDDGWYRAYARSRAIEIDRLDSARRVMNPVNSRGDVYGAFDRISYDKGSQVLAMFEAWLTPERFREGVRVYLHRHAYGTATSADFFRAIGEAAGKRDDALRAFTDFVAQTGVPLVDAALECGKGTAALVLAQRRLRPAGSRAAPREWTTPACFRYGAGGKMATQCAEVGRAARTVPLPGVEGCPDWVLGNANGIGYYVVRYDAALRKRFAARIPALPDPEAAALAGDAAILAGSGLLSIDVALAWSEALLGHPSPVVKRAAAQLLRSLRSEWLDARQAARKREIARERLVPLALSLGWLEQPGEADALRDLRVLVLPFAAEQAEGGMLREEAGALAMKWLASHESVPATMVGPVLDTAARFADASRYGELEAAALAETDRGDRFRLFDALAKVRDARLRSRALALAVEKAGGGDRVDGRDTLDFVANALSDEANRRAAFAFLREHFDALVAKLPPDTPANFITALDQLCARADRDAFAGFFAGRSAQFIGGPRRYAQALERIDLCLAAWPAPRS